MKAMQQKEITCVSLISMLWLCNLIGTSEETCLLPWDGIWYDSAFPLNNVTFDGGSQTVSGWKIRVYNTEGTNWHCLEEAGNTLLFKSTPGFESLVFGLPDLYMYRCIQWSKLSDDVYQYYVIGDEQSNIANQRLYVDIRDINATIDTACTASSPPSTAEFHILVKADRESSALSNCPSLFLHNFTYSHDNGAIASCEPANGSADGCYNRSQVAFDFTKCSAPFGFATNGLFYCVHSVSVGNAQYVITINPEIVDYTTTFKFTCFVLQKNGAYIYASDTKGSCKKNQTAFSKDSDGNGVVKMISHDSCPFSQPTDESNSDLTIIIAAVVSSAVLLIVTIVIILCCCCKKSIKRKLLCGQQTAESKEIDDKLPLTEPIDNEKHSSDVLSPETHSLSTTTSSSKQKTKKEKIPIQDGKQSTSIIQITSPYSGGKTTTEKEDLTQKGQNGDAVNKIGSLNDDDDKIKIDYEKYLEDSKKSKKPNKSGKVVFLEEIEESHVSSVITPKNEENLDQTNSMELEHIQRFNKTDGIINTDTSDSRFVQNNNESKVNDVEHLTHSDQLVRSLVGKTEKLTEELEETAESSKIKTANMTNLEKSKTLSKVPNSKPETSQRVKSGKEPSGKRMKTNSKTNDLKPTQKTSPETSGNGDIRVVFSERSDASFQALGKTSQKESDKGDGTSEADNGENKIEKNQINHTSMSVRSASVEGQNSDILLERGIVEIPSETTVIEMSVASVRTSSQLNGHTPVEKTVVSQNHKNQNDMQMSVASVMTSSKLNGHTPADKTVVSTKNHKNQNVKQRPVMSASEKSLKKNKKTEKMEEKGKSSKSNVTKSKKTGGRKRQKSNLGDTKLIDSYENSRCDTEMSFTLHHPKADELNSDEFREVNIVNENQPTAVQAWGNTTERERYKEDRSYDSEEEESIPQTPVGNEDEAVNQMTFDQVLELRPRSSMAPVSTLMRTNTASPNLFHGSKIGQRPTEREIESRNSSSTLKTTGLQEDESSTALTKVHVDESMTSLQIMDV